MDTNIFYISQKMDIIDENPLTKEQTFYWTSIENISENSIFISIPIREDEELALNIGNVINGRITSECCSFFFEATVINSILDTIPMWELSLPRQLKKVQMREYVRVATALEVKVEFMDECCQRKVIHTFTKDISAGGLQVIMPTSLPADSHVMMDLSLADNMIINIKGEFVRIKFPKTQFQKHFVSIKFCELDKKTRDKIIKYIFDKGIEKRKKEIQLFK